MSGVLIIALKTIAIFSFSIIFNTVVPGCSRVTFVYVAIKINTKTYKMDLPQANQSANSEASVQYLQQQVQQSVAMAVVQV